MHVSHETIAKLWVIGLTALVILLFATDCEKKKVPGDGAAVSFTGR